LLFGAETQFAEDDGLADCLFRDAVGPPLLENRESDVPSRTGGGRQECAVRTEAIARHYAPIVIADGGMDHASGSRLMNRVKARTWTNSNPLPGSSFVLYPDTQTK
jgi:hypothetical protein